MTNLPPLLRDLSGSEQLVEIVSFGDTLYQNIHMLDQESTWGRLREHASWAQKQSARLCRGECPSPYTHKTDKTAVTMEYDPESQAWDGYWVDEDNTNWPIFVDLEQVNFEAPYPNRVNDLQPQLQTTLNHYFSTYRPLSIKQTAAVLTTFVSAADSLVHHFTLRANKVSEKELDGKHLRIVANFLIATKLLKIIKQLDTEEQHAMLKAVMVNNYQLDGIGAEQIVNSIKAADKDIENGATQKTHTGAQGGTL